VLDDILYNIIHDIVLNTHREEKMARASSAAIIVEQMVEEAAGASFEDTLEGGADPAIVKTAAAIYKHGEVTLTGNPLQDVHEIRCPKCGLPRLLHPTDGNGAKKAEPGIEYCKKRPFIDKPFHDIYGQTFVPEGPGRGKKKKDMINPLKAQVAKEGTPGGSQDSAGTSPAPSEEPQKPISFPHAKCHNCNSFLPIKRMNNHMAKCIGGGGRDSSRTALLKIQNGSGHGSQSGSTPPGSRNGTPVPGGVRGNSSPKKREAGDDFDSDSSPPKKKTQMTKKTATTKLKVKAPRMMKSASQISSSNLSFEQKVPDSDDEDDDGDDDNDGDFGTVVVESQKKLKPGVKKTKDALGSKKKFLQGKGSAKTNLPPLGAASIAKIKVKRADGDMESESSQTLSSPN
jgi:hypothetical protein